VKFTRRNFSTAVIFRKRKIRQVFVQREVVSKERRRPFAAKEKLERTNAMFRIHRCGRGPSSLRLHSHMSRVCPLIQPFLQIFHTPYLGDPGRDYPPGDIPALFTACQFPKFYHFILTILHG
jgi:hypothetical protein